jgi:rRNA maturation endonuclease Nob1
VASAYEKAEEERLVARLVDTAASRGDAVVGLVDTAMAVNRRAVQTLVVQADRTTPGSVCRSCGWISAPAGEDCPSCGGTVDSTPDIVDALADSVRNSGGTVQHVMVDTRLAEDEIGAFLRYHAATA